MKSGAEPSATAEGGGIVLGVTLLILLGAGSGFYLAGWSAPAQGLSQPAAPNSLSNAPPLEI